MYIDVSKARTPEQIKQFSQIEKDGICPFCVENICTYHKMPIEYYDFWMFTDNMVPYSGAASHGLVIPNRHIEHIAALEPDEWRELKDIIDIKTAAMKFGGLAMRFGDILHTGSSVAHLHIHLFEPMIRNSDNDPKLKFKIST